jgi:hypothetical protein
VDDDPGVVWSSPAPMIEDIDISELSGVLVALQLLHRRCCHEPLLLRQRGSGSTAINAPRRRRAAEYIRENTACIRPLPLARGASRSRRERIYRRIASPLVPEPRPRRQIAEDCRCRGADGRFRRRRQRERGPRGPVEGYPHPRGGKGTLR